MFNYIVILYNSCFEILASRYKHHLYFLLCNRILITVHLNNCFSECIGLQDPYCAFDKVNRKCRSMREVPTSRWHEFYQNIQTGLHQECPSGKSLKSTIVSMLNFHLDGSFLDIPVGFFSRENDKIVLNIDRVTSLQRFYD